MQLYMMQLCIISRNNTIAYHHQIRGEGKQGTAQLGSGWALSVRLESSMDAILKLKNSCSEVSQQLPSTLAFAMSLALLPVP